MSARRISRWLSVIVACGVLAALPRPIEAQPARKLTLGIYAPSIEFGAATARLAYVRALAAHVTKATGFDVDARSYANLAALVRANVDFAIVDGPCYATHLGWRLVATAKVGGGASRAWALFSNGPTSLAGLRGKRLAYVATGCNDAGFVDNAMLESEVAPGLFGARVGKQDLTGAIAEVASYKTAHAVFAPIVSISASRGLTKVFDTGSVPNPALVALAKLPAATVDRVGAAVLGFGSSGPIGGWLRPSRRLYAAFSGRLAKRTKRPVFATPVTFELDLRDALAEPPTMREPTLVDVRRHVVAPPPRMD